MEANNNDPIIEKIRALIRLGENDGATQAEAENAMKFARRLMLKNNVSQQDLEEAKGHDELAADAEATVYGQVRHTTQGSSMTKWELSLAWAVSKLVGTVQFYLGGRTARRTGAGTIKYNEISGKPMVHQTFIFYGPDEDCRDASILMTEWSLAVVALARMKIGGALRGDGRSYCEGFCDALNEKMNSLHREERALIEAQQAQLALPQGATRSTALMVLNGSALMDVKKAKASEWLEKKAGVKLGKSSGSGSRGGAHNPGAYGMGKSDGKSANFSHQRTKKLGRGGK